ncbi:hypothetical protein CDSM653_01390 [Caldanaerobacter subterraneus subsp. pacificus DSM 12653]|uniref:Uncharacterized protein n=1 Tax=Caldanaerobacter subterraneus subsp. pacificus DSM 12653 TaxID=391606 RepID=A0A0F5PMG3_9THEO|nr:hypothetical protein CDSM653_01390 [Caldanaerobacter subterraneus subsp. pacificus DSM 12653]
MGKLPERYFWGKTKNEFLNNFPKRRAVSHYEDEASHKKAF